MSTIPALSRSSVILLLATACAAGSDDDALPPEAAPLIEARRAYTEPAPGREAVEYAREVLYLDPEPVFSDPDFTHVEADRGDNGVVLSVRLDSLAAHRLHDATAGHIGERLALLVRSRVVSVPVVQSALGPDDLPLQIALPPEAAGDVVAAVREKWPEE